MARRSLTAVHRFVSVASFCAVNRPATRRGGSGKSKHLLRLHRRPCSSGRADFVAGSDSHATSDDETGRPPAAGMLFQHGRCLIMTTADNLVPPRARRSAREATAVPVREPAVLGGWHAAACRVCVRAMIRWPEILSVTSRSRPRPDLARRIESLFAINERRVDGARRRTIIADPASRPGVLLLLGGG